MELPRGVVVPPEDPLYRAWQARRERSPTPPPAYSASKPAGAGPPATRPWWVRLLVDAVAVPFLQGFMLTLGVHWIRRWRRAGGLLGVLRGRFIQSDKGPAATRS
ncbi:hypothetical protein IWQ56_000060 [Coemansia nantahalensis]|uniref:Uncharacterized protein n=1 Tax=Coemansia helicoidea TaxID=1286919 RepID=A0ACC1LBN8_9FUNG|nr:hypothetical protein IWQ56_000060 [Coemansia nantahalensis]KAJ2804339.1 hypothetical protein H4R21_001681 [Coemansia helicoidea]